MQINKALSLFDYIGDDTKSTSILDDLANKQTQNIAGGIQAVDSGLSLGKFEDTLKKIENGDIEVNSTTLQNYLEFNKGKLTSEFNQLTEVYQINIETQISIEEGKVLVSDDTKSSEQLQQYLDKDQRFNKLIQQSSRLSKLIEWDHAKQQAGTYKEQDMPEQQIIDFLKDSRKVVNNHNKLLFTNQGLGFTSEGQTQVLIDKKAENKN